MNSNSKVAYPKRQIRRNAAPPLTSPAPTGLVRGGGEIPLSPCVSGRGKGGVHYPTASVDILEPHPRSPSSAAGRFVFYLASYIKK